MLVNVLASVVPDLQTYLLRLILEDVRRPPPWWDIALPKGKRLYHPQPRCWSTPYEQTVDQFSIGRTLHACQIAFEEMRKNMPNQPGHVQHPSGTSYVNIAPALAPGRSVSESEPLIATRRPIQPRPPQIRATESPNPPVTNGDSPVYTRAGLLDPAPEPSRKRGRPTKAEAAERDRAYAEKGQTYMPKKRSIKRMRPSMGPEALSVKDEDTLTPSRQTPQPHASTPVEETSSGKRRTRRQPRELSPIQIPTASIGTDVSRSGSEQRQGHDTEPEMEANVAESPSDRLLAGNRDRGSVGSTLSRPTQQESDSMERGHTEGDYPS